jgi:hypothetical protein
MNADSNMRKVIEPIVWIASIIDTLAYACKFLSVWHISSSTETAIILTDEILFVISVLILIGAPFIIRGRRLIVIVTGMIALCYLWFSSVAWWVMVK